MSKAPPKTPADIFVEKLADIFREAAEKDTGVARLHFVQMRDDAVGYVLDAMAENSPVQLCGASIAAVKKWEDSILALGDEAAQKNLQEMKLLLVEAQREFVLAAMPGIARRVDSLSRTVDIEERVSEASQPRPFPPKDGWN
jgi:hypothetical protein